MTKRQFVTGALPAVLANARAPRGVAVPAPPLVGPAAREPATANKVNADREVYSRQVQLPDNAAVPIGGLTRRWQGVDVFLAVRPGSIGAASSVAVELFAVIGGVRVLKAVGRLSEAFNTTTAGPQHVISFRGAQAETYELAISYDDTPGGPDAQATVTAIGTDEALSVDDLTIGAIPIQNDGRLLGIWQARALVSPARLVGLHAVNATAAAMYAQLFLSANQPFAGQVPFLSLAMGPGGSVFEWDRGLGTEEFGGAVSVALSTSATVYAAPGANDGRIVGWIR